MENEYEVHDALPFSVQSFIELREKALKKKNRGYDNSLLKKEVNQEFTLFVINRIGSIVDSISVIDNFSFKPLDVYAEEVYKKAYEEEMKKQQAAGGAAGADTGAAGNADADAGNANPGDDVVDGDFKEV